MAKEPVVDNGFVRGISVGGQKAPVAKRAQAPPRAECELVSEESSLVRYLSASDCSEVRLSVSAVSFSRVHNPGSGGAPPTASPPLRP